MTLLFFDGITNWVTTGVPKAEWTTLTGPVATAGRDGSASGAGSATVAELTLPSAAATCIFGLAHQVAVGTSVFGATTYGVSLRIGNTDHLTLTWAATGHLQLRLGGGAGTILATATTQPYVESVWRQMQVKAVIHATAGSCVVKVDGVEVINYTGQTGTASGSVTAIRHFATTATRLFIDDMYVCDAVDGTATDGRPNNDFLGDLSVKALRPTAAGDQTQWTPSTAPNWAAVDENPPNTTDYVSALAGSGLRDLYNLEDLPASGFDTVYAIRQTAYAAKTDAGTAVLRLCLKENATVTTGAANALPTTYSGVRDVMRKVKPSNGTVFTPADVNALQAGFEATT